ncbi:MAG TPA: hypothetical protein VN033_10865 [Vulgatibacter sp.]|nr:hypothetical protein [Vulgatibacter sp.]
MRCEFGSTTCEDARAGKCLSDFDEDGKPLLGWCSELADFDRDGIPDICDVCLLVTDPDQGNLNSHIEEESGSARLGDVCDPVPVVRFSQQVPTFKTIEGVRVTPKQDLEEGAELQVFDTRSWLGKDSTLLAGDFTENVTFRHCSCWAEDGVERSREGCIEQMCRPSQAELMSDGKWKRMTLTLDAQGPDLPPAGFPLRFAAGEYADGSGVIWRLHKDVDAQGEEKIESRNQVTTHGLVASVVKWRDAAVYASPRDQGKQLRIVVDLVNTPVGYYKDRSFVHQACLLSNCFGWVRPWEKYWNPPWDVRTIARFPFPVGPITSFDAWLGRDELPKDVADLVSPRLREAMASGAWAWASFSEPVALVESTGLEVQAVLVPREGSMVLAPVLVGVREGLLDFLEEPLLGPLDARGISVSAGGRVAFSISQRAVYVADESQGDAVLRYDVSTGQSEFVAGTMLEHVGPVLGLALDASRNRLYVLQVESERSVVSLTLHDLQRGERRTLLTVPHSGALESTSLAVGSSGAVLLAGGNGSHVTLWRYEVGEDGALIFAGSRTDAGQLADALLSGDVTVPLLREGELSLLRPEAASFMGGQPCSEL